MAILCPTPRDRMVDSASRPYFLWDSDVTLERFQEHLRTGTEAVRVHLVAKLMRQAKPDDVFEFVRLGEITRLWPLVGPRLGRTREFWTWWLQVWGVLGHGGPGALAPVAESVPVIEPPVELPLEGHRVRVDTAHEILVDKLCALVQRSEVRDLFDVQQLLAHGGDLRRAVADAPRKDGGFSPLTLAWLLEQLAVGELGRAEGWSDDRLRGLEDFRQQLLRQLKDWSRPEA